MLVDSDLRQSAFSAELSPAYSGLITILLIWFCYRLFKSTRDRILREAEQNRQQSIHNIDDQ